MIRDFEVKAEKFLDVAIGNGDGALFNGTEALKAAVFVKAAVFAILMASLLAL